MSCVWEERGLCLCDLAPRGVTVAAQLPAATSPGAAALGHFSLGAFNSRSVLLEQNSCIKTK